MSQRTLKVIFIGKSAAQWNGCGHSLGAFASLQGRRLCHVHHFWKCIQTRAAKNLYFWTPISKLQYYVHSILKVGGQDGDQFLFFCVRQHRCGRLLHVHIWTSAHRATRLFWAPCEGYVKQRYTNATMEDYDISIGTKRFSFSHACIRIDSFFAQISKGPWHWDVNISVQIFHSVTVFRTLAKFQVDVQNGFKEWPSFTSYSPSPSNC